MSTSPEENRSLLLPCMYILRIITNSVYGFKPEGALLDVFFQIIGHSDYMVRTQACRNISKIITENNELISLVINNSTFLEKLMFTIQSDTYKVKFF